jgi:hypothetical protein
MHDYTIKVVVNIELHCQYTVHVVDYRGDSPGTSPVLILIAGILSYAYAYTFQGLINGYSMWYMVQARQKVWTDPGTDKLSS